MDTTETYIKMRVAAIPDLGMGDEEWAFCSPFFFASTNNAWVAPNGSYYCRSSSAIGCQLERQDQLQEMIKEPLIELLHSFSFAVLSKYPIEADYWGKFTSLEQLWLAFVMKEKFNKIWNGTDWI